MAKIGWNSALEVIVPQTNGLKTRALRQRCRNFSLERVDTQVQKLKMVEKAEFMWDVPTKLVLWQVELPEVCKIRNGRGDATNQPEIVKVDGDDATTTTPTLPAHHTLPSAVVQ